MTKTLGIGIQNFEQIRQKNNFYIDKTNFIKEWWETNNQVTLITRPRRFGKTLTMSMLYCFFSNKYKDKADLFSGLSIWKEEKYQNLQGTYPVIFMTFAGIKPKNYEKFLEDMKMQIHNLYLYFHFLEESYALNTIEKKRIHYLSDFENNLTETEMQYAFCQLSLYLEKHFGKKVIILLDEYDTPMQEAYLHNYWEEAVQFLRGMFGNTFKENPSLERAIMTGITRVSKESIFSDFNNLVVVTTSSKKYETVFGFTEEEVFEALDSYGLGDRKQEVKTWYDGFTFGNVTDIYNPWSILNYLQERELKTYWANTSSNGLVSKLIQEGSPELKREMEQLLQGKELEVFFDEQIVFHQLDKNEEAIWSFLVASGYLKIAKVKWTGRKNLYYLMITNLETEIMFETMIQGWFSSAKVYNVFIKALLKDDIKAMNAYINQITRESFSFFDVGNRPSEFIQPERFYHGFVLGLLVELRDQYEVKSNRESGFGRYDIALFPLKRKEPAIIIEFKVIDLEEETSLQETVQSALTQIEQKNYDAEFFARGISKDRIYHYGFAFRGKEVLIGTR